MPLSIAEKSYLYDSLSSNAGTRPDGRLPHQFRPLEVYTDFLPSSNGSSRIIASDSSECIVSVKANVVDHQVQQDLFQVEVDIAGQRDDSSEVETLTSLLNRVLESRGSIDASKLKLTRKYSYKLFIDVLVISSSSHPVSLISFTIFSALNSTYLPKIISSFDDLEVEELPTFHDADMVKLDVSPPLVFILAVVGENVFMDAAANESEVADNGLIITWSGDKIVAPIRTVALNNSDVKGFNPLVLQRGIQMVQQYAGDVVRAFANL
ncbi:ZYRO0F07920p [Zygosaccharomyces rouxii]|uniref:Ribosomal RNA-processing protein 42 n=1 Tax=Zygosaccharomyces rouxii (strain ATCC 2623 / CBS 732 / NBRC 1130 / NCYC 568 / NRRL Y-229) TaxID=559307 RepID=C5DXU7_ZYGRC|nr:uncharacterized protein ZYRO0F07920g [Zygosaccharomyces rouxii]KAH9199366.1 ribosomal protein S5 domain 2-type protein [Zygosaccharomyces rouxii]CAR28608.1 ZYRO0F07920p [Zygosaccharomyces rouxii]